MNVEYADALCGIWLVSGAGMEGSGAGGTSARFLLLGKSLAGCTRCCVPERELLGAAVSAVSAVP